MSPSDEAGSSNAEAGLLAEWFRAHFDHLWRLARRLGVPRQHADDVVQEAFITASRRADDIEPGCERRFLIAVTVKISANQRRRSARQLDRPGEIEHELADTPDAEQLLLQKRLRELFDAALDELSADHRAVFVLHELEGFSVPEIAQFLDIPSGTAASRLGRARRHFQESAAQLRRIWFEP
jgi:RNA polymerase sigma-70 factor (ECF subfamily)